MITFRLKQPLPWFTSTKQQLHNTTKFRDYLCWVPVCWSGESQPGNTIYKHPSCLTWLLFSSTRATNCSKCQSISPNTALYKYATTKRDCKYLAAMQGNHYFCYSQVWHMTIQLLHLGAFPAGNAASLGFYSVRCGIKGHVMNWWN